MFFDEEKNCQKFAEQINNKSIFADAKNDIK